MSLDDLLDDERLDGAHDARISVRPERIGVPVTDTTSLIAQIRYECQFWGGANSAMIPVHPDGLIYEPYIRILAGSAIDAVEGMSPFGLFDIRQATVQLSPERGVWNRQLAVGLLEFGKPGHQACVTGCRTRTIGPVEADLCGVPRLDARGSHEGSAAGTSLCTGTHI